MADHLEVRVANPVANGGFRTSEEVVEHGDFVAEEHQAVNEMRANETGTTGDEDAFALGWSEKPDGGEAGEGGVGDGLDVGVEDRLGLVRIVGPGELGVLDLLLLDILVLA